MYLWNERVRKPGVTEAEKDKALAALRSLGHRFFCRALRRDCYRFLQEEHGKNWHTKPRKDKNGSMTSLGRDQLAVCSIIWHATNTNWFEYLCGSRLLHF